MIYITSNNDRKQWGKFLNYFSNYDIYYFYEYMNAFYMHGDGKPFLFFYEGKGLRGICAYMLRDISEETWAKAEIMKDKFYDAITPYGYGGWIFDGDTSTENIKSFLNEYTLFMKENNIVCAFTRWHPLLQNQDVFRGNSNVIDLGKTIAIDLSSEQTIWENITSKNRNMIRKAEKNGVEIHHAKDPALFNDFKVIYNATMDRDNADKYYYFGDNFYESIHNDLYDNYEMFYATLNHKIIAMSIILYANGFMNYHLSGSLAEYRNLAPSNLLLYKAALWGCNKGFKTFHLGGGVGSSEDNLYKFKAAFNRHSNLQFSIGKEIFDKEMYDELVNIRKMNDKEFDENSNFFPLYRS